jgi:TonB-linked SusC/RagA family outer membrane protein
MFQIQNRIKNIGRKISFALKGCVLLVAMLSMVSQVSAQEKTIPVVRGIVKNEAGEILSGATVLVEKTKIYATTGKDGSFELKDIPEKSSIRISYVGHNARVIKLKEGETTINVVLERSSNTLGEVVVNTGLYKRPVGNFTGAAKSYTGEELKAMNPTNVLQALATVDPSVRIQQDNAQGSNPNQLPILQIRGANNLPVSTQGAGNTGATPVSNGDFMSSYLLNPNQPLIILDGFQTSLQTIYDMDINRIANITVLKDAAATAAYGSKAANGVLVIDTKQPTGGKVQVTYSINFNFDAVDLSSYHLMNASELLEAQRIAGVYNDPNNHYNDLGLQQWYDYRKYQVASGVNTYWLAQPVQNGFGINHSLSVSGGSRSVRYSLSLNYNDAEGVMKQSGRTRLGLNYTLSYVGKNIRLSNNTSVGYAKANNTPWGSFSNYTSQFPYFKPYDSAGNIIKILEPNYATLGFSVPVPGGTTFTNAAYNSTLESKNYNYYTSFTNNTNFEWTMTRELRMRGSISYSANTPGAEAYYPADHTMFANAPTPLFTELGTYSQTRGKNDVWDGKIGLDYIKRMGKHTIFANVGASAQQTNSNSTTVGVSGIPNDYLDELALANGYGLTSIKPSTSLNSTRSLSTFASVSYNYSDRYTAEVTVNASGSSQFGSNNRLAPFWAAGAGWNVDKESFFHKNWFIQQLRIRASTGITGNQNFSASMAQPSYQYNVQNNYRLQLGTNVMAYANPDLKWQQTLKNNIGAQMGLFNGVLSVGIDFYSELTNNLILPLDVAPSTGFNTYQDNLGATKNTGYEVSLSAAIIKNKKKNIFWSLSFNTGHFDNVITKLSPAIEAINNANNATTDPKGQTSPLPRYEVGESMTRIWAVKSLGIDPATGKEIFQKLDGSKTFIWDPNDKVPVGDANSKLKGMIGSNFTFKGFTFNFNLSYQYGGQMYNQTLVDKIENVNLLLTNADERVLTQRWKQPGDHASFKALQAGGGSITNATSRFVQDDNFIDGSSITVGYSFPPNLNWVRTLHLSTPRFFITQNNVFHWGTIKAERGTAYPFARSFSVGLSTAF